MDPKWPNYQVSDLQQRRVLLVEDGNHGEYRPRKEEFGNGGTRFIRASDMAGGRVLFESADRISEEAVHRIRKGIGKGGDIIFSHKGTVGKLALTPQDAPPYVCSPQTTLWRPLEEDVLDRRFLYYYMQSWPFRRQWVAQKGETDMADYVSLSTQRMLRIWVPPIGYQRAIARVLGALDDKIQINREMSCTLEALAQAIFKSWFIDFDPVTAKADGRQLFGMSEETATLFPSRFADSELGPIPEHWEVRSVSELFEINPSRDLQKGTIAPYLSMQNTPSTGPVPDVVETRQYGSGVKFRNGDTLMAKITPCLENGKTAYVQFLEDEQVGWGSTEFIVLRSRKGIPLEFSYFFARDDGFREHAIANMTGSSGRQRVPVSSLQHYQFPLPPLLVLQAFGNMAASAMAKMQSNAEQSRTLAQLRDLLLPKLLSGEIRLAESEEAVEVVGA